jgi:hypothetical protein
MAKRDEPASAEHSEAKLATDRTGKDGRAD